MNLDKMKSFDRDELLGMLGLQTKPAWNDYLVPGLAVFGAGLVVGSALGLLFAPRPGRELRQDIGKRIQEVPDSLSALPQKAAEMGQRAGEVVQNVREQVRDAAERVTRAAETAGSRPQGQLAGSSSSSNTPGSSNTSGSSTPGNHAAKPPGQVG